MPPTNKGAKRPAAITRLQETDSTGKRNWLIYAPSGFGKTVLAGTAPKALILAVEHGGTESAKMMGSTADELVIDTVGKLESAYDYFKNGSGCDDYDWVVLDSLSEIEDMYWQDLQGDSVVKKLQDYGAVETRVKRLVDKWNRLPINVLYTAGAARLDTEDVETDEERIMLIPALGTAKGVLSQRIAAKVTLVGYLSVLEYTDEDSGEIKEMRRLQLRGSERVTAKDRHGIAPKTGFLRNPTIPRMIEKAEAALAGGNGSEENLEKPKKKKADKPSEKE
jgi:hypothetical protein